MGIGDFFNKAYHYVVDKAKNVATSIKGAANTAWEKTKDLGRKVAEATRKVSTTVIDAGKKVAQTVYSDGKSVVQFVGDRIKQGQDTLQKTAEGFSSALSSPFTWLAVGVVGLVVLSKA